ncbi:MAG: hypothetical protein IPO05_02055 [Flavobacteriales bacterium]|jgi:hypothetical protein|nr:hypothetical protein [Flavobacteriales bacterium]MBK9512419.1 hypothetical protein [Flavobacteriales bacterium]MBP7448825.1 hypothetical protein [Flavobacteriales bacterium]HOZ41204.1 hypothetical protein [Flavobacteriales bacterium]
MAYDFIEHAKRIEHKLRQQGFSNLANRIEDARLGSSTSGELLMRLRYEAKEINAGERLPIDIRDDLEELISAIDDTGI